MSPNGYILIVPQQSIFQGSQSKQPIPCRLAIPVAIHALIRHCAARIARAPVSADIA